MKLDIMITSLMLFTLTFLLFSSQLHAQTRLSNFTDQQSLLTFKSHITSDPHKALQSWNITTSFCSWRGVTCNTTKQRVTSLDVRNFGLVGNIAPHVGNLSFLSELNLQGNLFSGNIPLEIGNLFRLKSLNLSSNTLKGGIPASLSFCSRLIMLDLSKNKLQGRIPSELGTLPELEGLSFRDNYLTGQIPASFVNLSSLTNLILKQNHLTGSIPEGLGHLPYIVNIDLSLNQLDGEIPPSVFNRSSLIQLGLAVNQFSGTLPSDMFFKLVNLVNLYIGGNRFSGNLPVSLGNASNLVQADLSRNNFTGHVPLLWNLPNIQVLSFDTNQLVSDGDHGWDFLTSLRNSTQLLVFSLAANLLTGRLPSSVGNLSRQLQQFVIGGNNIQGTLPSEISNLVGLTLLSVEYNSFSGTIPPTLANLPVLQNLYLHKNQFSGEVPRSLGNLTSLSEISLSRNKLNGTIPQILGNLQHLRVLDFSNNMFRGTIPIQIFSILNLGQLNLSFNSLNGNLPEQIGNLTTIMSIDLSNNHFTGAIPYSIGGCTSLESLILSHNSLTGIPSSFADIKGIEYIDLSSNNLSGKIPSSLGSLMYLQYLDLSHNQLVGPVPSEGVFSNKSAVYLSGNSRLCSEAAEFHLPKCSTTKHSNEAKLKLIVGLTVALGGTLVLLLGASLIFFFRKRSRDKATTTVNTEVSPQEKKYKLYTYFDLKSSTRNFSSENLIGQGSFGSVYKAVLMDGTVAAIKVFNLERQGASKSFIAECEALRNIRHRNLVKILSVCVSGNFKALILPYMVNGSLEQWLHNGSELQSEVGEFHFEQRLKIVSEVASAMEYLHHDCELTVVHCDLKPSNVLLDEYMCAHVSDFGIARIVNDPSKGLTNSSVDLKGSLGYIAPEYGFGASVSTKGDVYSFGILLLEILTGKRPADEEFTGEMNLQEWVAKDFPHNVPNILDSNLVTNGLNSCNNDSSIAVLEIGLRCATKVPEERPTMRDASLAINSIVAGHSRRRQEFSTDNWCEA